MLKITVFIWSACLVSNILSITFNCSEFPIQAKDDLNIFKLSGVWYLYSIASRDQKEINRFKPDCEKTKGHKASAMIKYMVATDYTNYLLLMGCKDRKKQSPIVTASILTRQLKPTENAIDYAGQFLEQIEFPMESLKKVVDQTLCLVYRNE